jgi:hypothetical protein
VQNFNFKKLYIFLLTIFIPLLLITSYLAINNFVRTSENYYIYLSKEVGDGYGGFSEIRNGGLHALAAAPLKNLPRAYSAVRTSIFPLHHIMPDHPQVHGPLGRAGHEADLTSSGHEEHNIRR